MPRAVAKSSVAASSLAALSAKPKLVKTSSRKLRSGNEDSKRACGSTRKQNAVDIRQRAAARQKALNLLEQDNFNEDNTVNMKIYTPDGTGGEDASKGGAGTQGGRKRKRAVGRTSADWRTLKGFMSVLANVPDDGCSLRTCAAKPSALPDIPLCAVCGFEGIYTCTLCGARYCCQRCLDTHRDTRCLKFVS